MKSGWPLPADFCLRFLGCGSLAAVPWLRFIESATIATSPAAVRWYRHC